ncbi:MAG: DNA alkylation repair protein [Nanoarchaeota archaeon]|nr:DNA alkylation repair protein [Nanoarchaeota archaeon]
MENKDLKELEKRLEKEKNPEKAIILQRFFKTGPGEYGEGDIFLGIIVPVQRKIVNEFKELDIESIQKLMDSNIHEKRLIGLLILVEKYKKSNKEKNEIEKKFIYDFYLDNTKRINNWDLVDLTAPNILGNYLLAKPHDILYKLVKSDNLWERRIAVISTFAFIRQNDFNDLLKICEILISDKHDLIHKAVGWMLRETGKRDKKTLEEFLKFFYKKMPRTMLRYAIEKFPDAERKKWLKL